ncbi:acyl-CoA dehydrogenase family protein [Dickeya sp. CFBP 2040]|uniref:Acyl-CoA dehydrogenase family protein n=1 Tax=Dickeya poaceiphila TaxID=568768 RepID=A0A5B8IBR9_9GAMM|nr:MULTISPECIES: hypothetical protein [Dickeya]NKI73705.1 acyl-CoA dehydrogenase family protein [Dickeya sp. CFBP 2040]QDX31493.1 acyl-CoA dehydrogenase family protein [Dickeya poaceiphila]
MHDVLFNDIYALFKNQSPNEAIRRFRLNMTEKNVQEPAVKLALIADVQQNSETDPVLEAMGLCIESDSTQTYQTLHRLYGPVSIAARLGLLSRILSISWQHLSSRTSFGVKTTKHQLIKAEFAEISNQIDFMLTQWELRISQDDYSGIDEDHWQISFLTNRAEKLMGGHGYLLGNSHSLSYLSVMIYSLYGKSDDEETLFPVEHIGQPA